MAGPEKKSRVVSDKKKRLVAYHEAGHAILHKLLPNCDAVHEVSIIPRGRAGGYTLSLPDEDNDYVSKKYMTALWEMDFRENGIRVISWEVQQRSRQEMLMAQGRVGAVEKKWSSRFF